MGKVRELREEDLPGVVRIQMMVEPRHRYPERLAEYFRDVYLKSPLYDAGLPSLVYEEEGEVAGFMGRVARPMWFGERRIQGAVLHHLMVETGSRGRRAGVSLVQEGFKGVDLGFTDAANDLGRRAGEAAGGVTVFLYSFSWTFVLYPMSLMVQRAEQKAKWIRAFAPVARLADYGLRRLLAERFQIRKPKLQAERPDAATLAGWLREASQQKTVRAEYDSTVLQWLLDRAALNRRFGELEAVLLRNDTGEIAGSYVYYVHPGGVSEVVQLVARKGSRENVLDHLLYTAGQKGSIAVSGRVQTDWIPVLSSRHCFVEIGPWFMIITDDAELKRTCLLTDFFFSRLDGEWSLGFSSPE